MPVLSNGVQVQLSDVATIALAGGDIYATYTPPIDFNPSERGMHMMIAYAAPLQKLYDDWGNRTLDAIRLTLETWRGDPRAGLNQYPTQQQAVAAEVNKSYDDVTRFQSLAETGVKQWDMLTQTNRDEQHYRRIRINEALTMVDVTAAAVSRGEGFFKLYVADLNLHSDKIMAIYSAQGQTAARTIGDAVSYSGQVVDMRSRTRQYHEQIRELEISKELTLRARKQEKSSAVMGAITAIASQFLG